MEKPTIKISKVAREFNVGHNTIIEFLQKKGFNVDLDPNAKLSDEMYKLLKKEFSEPIQKKESRVNANQSEVRFEPELTGTYEIEFNNVQEKTAKSKNAKQTPSKQEKFHADKPTREVQVLQNALKEIGFFNSVSDGIYGPLTRKAVMIFQESAGLPQDADLDDEAYQTLLEKINAYTKANQAKPGKEQTTRSEQTTILENENPINENKPGLSEYEFVINEDLNNRNFSSNFLIVRIGWERIREFVVDGDHFDFDRANWGSILAAFILPSDLTDEIRILPFITLPVDNLPLILKSANVDFEGENFKVETDLYIIETSFKYQITSERLLKELPTLSSNRILGNDKIYEGAVFISKEEFDKIRELGIKGFIGERFNKAAISKLDTDSPYLDIEDELGFEGDYKALASVMAYKKLEPPLAIGLFGNWGSGKSFFMNKLEKEINILANDKNLQDVYCQEVVQVKFNSWHYSDSNLWASLITKIFEDLQKHKNDDSEAVKNLFKNLNSTKGLVAAAQQKIDSIKVEVQLLENEKAKAEGEIEKKAGELNTLRYRDIAVAIWNNPVIKENREKIDQIFPDKLSENIQSIKTRVNELSSFTNQVIESAKIIYKFRKGKKPIALLVGFAVFVLSCFLILQYQGKSLDFLNWVTVKSSLIVTALTQLVGFLMPVMGKVNTAYKNLKDLEQTYVELVEKEKSANYLAINDLERLIEMKQVELRKYEEEIAQLKQEKKEKEQEIDDITSGRKLSQFIQRIVSDSKYKESLGIISWIRKDFEELN
ncbi:MAG: peptidoglycan-binding protein, partial [Bacteroidales bacterium]|nr:peptidoglycan-binding protein [Bacteroidales bacterium]